MKKSVSFDYDYICDEAYGNSDKYSAPLDVVFEKDNTKTEYIDPVKQRRSRFVHSVSTTALLKGKTFGRLNRGKVVC